MTFPVIANKRSSTSPGQPATKLRTVMLRGRNKVNTANEDTLIERSRNQRILSLDGGGIRGVLTASILAELEDRLIEQSGDPSTRLVDHFDYFAGTSTGGILVCLYLLPAPSNPGRPLFSAREVLCLYRTHGPAIFKRSLGRKLSSLMGLRREKFCSQQMERIMHQFMGHCCLKDLIRPCIIPAYDIQERSAYYFRQELAAIDPAHDYPVWQVARATAGAPLYFGPKLVTATDGSQRPLIDGGVFANNPSLVACNMLKNMMPEEVNLKVVSVGTGDAAISFKMEDLKAKGMLNSWKSLLNIVSSARCQSVDQQLKEMMKIDNGCQYYRLNPCIKHLNTRMDDVSDQQLDGLMALGEAYLTKDSTVVSKLVDELMKY